MVVTSDARQMEAIRESEETKRRHLNDAISALEMIHAIVCTSSASGRSNLSERSIIWSPLKVSSQPPPPRAAHSTT
jgi:hypothetical protein